MSNYCVIGSNFKDILSMLLDLYDHGNLSFCLHTVLVLNPNRVLWIRLLGVFVLESITSASDTELLACYPCLN